MSASKCTASDRDKGIRIRTILIGLDVLSGLTLLHDSPSRICIDSYKVHKLEQGAVRAQKSSRKESATEESLMRKNRVSEAGGGE